MIRTIFMFKNNFCGCFDNHKDPRSGRYGLEQIKRCRAILAPTAIEASNARNELLFRETRGPCADFRRWEVDARIYRFLIGGYTDFLSLGSEESGGRVYFTI